VRWLRRALLDLRRDEINRAGLTSIPFAAVATWNTDLVAGLLVFLIGTFMGSLGARYHRLKTLPPPPANPDGP
jgi:hypothetical protein